MVSIISGIIRVQISLGPKFGEDGDTSKGNLQKVGVRLLSVNISLERQSL